MRWCYADSNCRHGATSPFVGDTNCREIRFEDGHQRSLLRRCERTEIKRRRRRRRRRRSRRRRGARRRNTTSGRRRRSCSPSVGRRKTCVALRAFHGKFLRWYRQEEMKKVGVRRTAWRHNTITTCCRRKLRKIQIFQIFKNVTCVRFKNSKKI